MHAPLTVALVTVAALGASAPAPVAPATSLPYLGYPDCTSLHTVYSHGVGLRHARDRVRRHTKAVTTFYRNDRLYALNRVLDRDHDGVACEQR